MSSIVVELHQMILQSSPLPRIITTFKQILLTNIPEEEGHIIMSYSRMLIGMHLQKYIKWKTSSTRRIYSLIKTVEACFMFGHKHNVANCTLKLASFYLSMQQINKCNSALKSVDIIFTNTDNIMNMKSSILSKKSDFSELELEHLCKRYKDISKQRGDFYKNCVLWNVEFIESEREVCPLPFRHELDAEHVDRVSIDSEVYYSYLKVIVQYLRQPKSRRSFRTHYNGLQNIKQVAIDGSVFSGRKDFKQHENSMFALLESNIEKASDLANYHMYLNVLGCTFVMVGKIEEAKRFFEKSLGEKEEKNVASIYLQILSIDKVSIN